MRFHDDPGCYVAHYTQCTTAIDYILASNTLKLGPLSKTNDPRETKVWRFAVGGNSSTHDENIALSRRNTEFDALLKRGCKVLCVSEDAYDAWKTNTSQRAYGKPRMWYQYAENHKGVCLIFDKDALNSRIQQQFEQNTVHSGRIECVLPASLPEAIC